MYQIHGEKYQVLETKAFHFSVIILLLGN